MNRPEHSTELALHAALTGAVEMGNEIIRLRALLSKWVTYMDLSGVQPVSGDLRDNPILALLADSRKALSEPT